MLVLLPLLLLIIGAYVTYAAGRMGAARDNKLLAGATASVFSALAFLLALLVASDVWNSASGSVEYTIGSGLLRIDALGMFLILVSTFLTLMVSIYSTRYMRDDSRLEHFFPLLLLMSAGIVGIGMATDLFTIYVFYELMCIASYVLVIFRKEKWDAVEAGMKYVVLSAAGSAIALFAMALIYGQFGSFDLDVIMGEAIGGNLAFTTMILLIVGFGVKAAIVPLHTWLPDAHSAAPSGISAMLSGIVIQTGFIVLLRFVLVFEGVVAVWQVLIGLAVLTMTVGNIMAFVQFGAKKPDLKRILAYSSIAQMGYIILGVSIGMAYGIESGVRGGIFHIMTHAFMKGLAFLCAGAFIMRIGTRNVRKMQGIGYAMPFTAFAFVIAALSLSGAPPLSGFMSEWMIFKAGVDAAVEIGWIGIMLSVILLINSVISLGYYLPIIKTLFLRPKRKIAGAKRAPLAMLIPIIILATVTLILGIWPELGLQAVEPVVDFFMSLGGGA
jgi:proton-translocating NADH-quinone oxidoreductase chain N